MNSKMGAQRLMAKSDPIALGQQSRDLTGSQESNRFYSPFFLAMAFSVKTESG